MKKLFSDPNNTLSTCDAESCEGCEVSEKLVCHFNGKQLMLFWAMALAVFIFAAYSIYIFNPFFLIPWILFIIIFFGFIEIRVMCSHCPHYAEPGLKALKCWANYGSPKLWKYRPGPMSVMEKAVFYLGFIIIAGPSIIFLLIQRHFLLAVIYSVLLIIFKLALKYLFCKRCINFACPFNNVDYDTRKIFFEKNTDIKKAWEKKENKEEKK